MIVLKSKIVFSIFLSSIFIASAHSNVYANDDNEIGFISIKEKASTSKEGTKLAKQNEQNIEEQSPPMNDNILSVDAQRDEATEKAIQEAMRRGDYNEMQRLILEGASRNGGSFTPSNDMNSQSSAETSNSIDDVLRNIGFLNLALNGKTQPDAPTQTPSQEAEKVLSKLRIIASNQQEKKFNECLLEMKALSKEYPESAIFRKWLGIYYNANGLNQESNDEFGNLLYMFPLDKTLWDDVAIQYYFADNYRKLKDFKNAELTIRNVLEKIDSETQAEKTNVKTYHNMFLKRPDLVKFLFKYQQLLLEEEETKTIDKEKLDELWALIPKEDYKILDNYYGFNLSNLEYIYGRFYNRKDILRNYVEHEGKTTDKETSQKVMEAKTIISNKY